MTEVCPHPNCESKMICSCGKCNSHYCMMCRRFYHYTYDYNGEKSSVVLGHDPMCGKPPSDKKNNWRGNRRNREDRPRQERQDRRPPREPREEPKSKADLDMNWRKKD